MPFDTKPAGSYVSKCGEQDLHQPLKGTGTSETPRTFGEITLCSGSGDDVLIRNCCP
ncbi:MAG: hypothetical protein IBV53_00890 [Candidatus Atribacteria bacterium]